MEQSGYESKMVNDFSLLIPFVWTAQLSVAVRYAFGN